MAPIAWRLTIRTGPRVARESFEDLGPALDALEAHARRAAGQRRRTVRAGLWEYAPAQQVQARIELHGPRGARGGVDVRGNGATAAYVGRLRRRPVEQRGGETPYAALRRVLASSVSVDP